MAVIVFLRPSSLPSLSSFLQTSHTQPSISPLLRYCSLGNRFLPTSSNSSSESIVIIIVIVVVSFGRSSRYASSLSNTSSSDDNSETSEIESCFNTEDEQEETDIDTKPTDVDTDVDGNDEADLAWIAGKYNAYLPEYYLDHENDSDESVGEDEDYSDNSILLLDMIEVRFYRYVPILYTCRLLLSNR